MSSALHDLKGNFFFLIAIYSPCVLARFININIYMKATKNNDLISQIQINKVVLKVARNYQSCSRGFTTCTFAYMRVRKTLQPGEMKIELFP